MGVGDVVDGQAQVVVAVFEEQWLGILQQNSTQTPFQIQHLLHRAERRGEDGLSRTRSFDHFYSGFIILSHWKAYFYKCLIKMCRALSESASPNGYMWELTVWKLFQLQQPGTMWCDASKAERSTLVFTSPAGLWTLHTKGTAGGKIFNVSHSNFDWMLICCLVWSLYCAELFWGVCWDRKDPISDATRM